MSTHDRSAPPAPARRRPSKAVYRRRRIVALLIALAVLALLAWGATALVGLAAGSADDVAPADAAEAPAEPRQPVACGTEDLEVALEAPDQAAAGEAVPFSVTVTNAGPGPCMVDAGRSALAVTVRSGQDRVWSSADCPAGRAERMLLLAVGDSSQVDITWPGTRSAAGCSGDRVGAGAGTYRAQAELGGVSMGEEPVVIDLR